MMDPLQAATFINSARRLAIFVNSARAIAQDHKTGETVVMMVCLLAALVVANFLITLLKFIRIILYLCLLEGGRQMLLLGRDRQRRGTIARQHASQEGLRISTLEDGQETERTPMGRQDGEIWK